MEFPELTPAGTEQVDVTVGIGEVPEHLPEARGSGILFEAAANDFLFRFEGVGRFRVQEGNRIIVQGEKNSSPEDIRLVLLGSCMGALLHQRGMLALHGSAISDGRESVILSGPSGVGKSSLAAGLHELGYEVIADDISVIDTRGEGPYSISPGIPQLKLWKDVLSHLDKDTQLDRVRPQLEKYRQPIRLAEKQIPALTKVVLLNPSNERGYSWSEILGREKFQRLRSSTYRLQFIDKMDRTEGHFLNLSRLVNSIRLMEVTRPHHPMNIPEFAKYVAELIFPGDG